MRSIEYDQFGDIETPLHERLELIDNDTKENLRLFILSDLRDAIANDFSDQIQSIIENKGLKIPAKNGGKYPIDELFSKYDFTLTDLHVGIDFLRREES